MSINVTVLMPVYNSVVFIKDSIESILNQSYKNFEFLIIDDGSTDGTTEILKRIKDKRIKIVYNKSNLKLVKSLNKGIDIASGKYIVRMDADDISLPYRLERQIEFMENNPNIGICGTWTRNFGKNSDLNIYPITDKEIKTRMLFKCSFSHPSVIMRKSLLDKYALRYSEEFLYAEDYELWLRSSRFLNFANIPEILLKYRVGNGNVSNIFSEKQNELTRILCKKNLYELCEGGISDTLLDILINEKSASREQLISIHDKFESIIKNNIIYDRLILRKYFQRAWNKICYKSSKTGLSAFFLYRQFRILRQEDLSKKKEIRFLIKSILKI